MAPSKILDRITKLHAQAESAKQIGNEAEAAAFAAKVQSLLMEHKLSMAEVAEFDAKKSIEIGTIIHSWDHVEVGKKRVVWQEHLAHWLCKYNQCEVLVFIGSNQLRLIGTEESTQIVSYLLNMLARHGQESMDKEYRKVYYQHKKLGLKMPKGWRYSYITGYVAQIASRLKEQDNKFRANHNGERGLMVIDQEAALAKEMMEAMSTGKAIGTTRKATDREAFDKGREEGDKVDINGNAVNGDGSSRLQLTHG